MLLILFGFVIGCQKSDEDFIYVNEKYGFSFEIPSSWEGKYKIVEVVDGIIDFKYTGYEDESGGHQEFFFIGVVPIDEYEERLDEPTTGILLTVGEKYVYILNMPLDNIILDKDKVDEYLEIRVFEDEINERFSLID